MTSRVRALITLTLFGLASPGAMATAYKWVDQNGEVHYSQTPPPGVNAEVIKSQPAPGPSSAATRETTGKPAAANTPQIPDSKAKAEDAAVRAENCTAARGDMETLKTRSRVNVKDEKGLYHRLTEEERQVRTEETQKMIDEFCGQ